MSQQIGKSVPRVDAFDKITGRTLYCDDRTPKDALIAKIKHSTIAHGIVKSIDTSAAEAMEGVVKIVTCFDVPDIQFATPGHPWSTDPGHRDIPDRKLLNTHVRYYGDDICAVIAVDEITAKRAVDAIKVEYEELPFVLDVQEAMQPGKAQIHEEYENNLLAHTSANTGDYQKAIQEPGLRKFEGWYDTPTVQHCHIENHVCFSYEENGEIVIVASTQIPHIVRRIVGVALGIPWGKVRVIKPYVGGGFGNKQDALYEPLCAFLTTQVGGRCVKLECTREETFVSNRVRHAVRSHIISWVRPDGTFAARKLECFSDQGAYASHGHAIAAKGMGCFKQLYPCDNIEADAYTVYTNKPAAGAMRGYGIPQAMYPVECHTDEIATAMGIDPVEFRRKNLMPVGYVDPFSHNELYSDTFNQCLTKGAALIDYDKKKALYKNQTGPIRRGVGCAVFWYNTGVYPISLETSSCRMALHPGGFVTLQLGETEIGQGADTAFSQMAAEILGVDYRSIHIASCQDTDLSPFGLGVYASRGTYSAGFSIRQTALQLREKILSYASEMTRVSAFDLTMEDGVIYRTTDGRKLMTLEELAEESLYSTRHSDHLTAESTFQSRNNAYTFGCCFAEVEVDIALCKATLVNIVNVHDCGRVINPALAEAQVHGGQSMAIGYGLSEQLLFDPKTGKPLNNNLLDYKISTIMDHPRLTAAFVENPDPTSAFGTKGLGEPPACPVAPAIRNAILNATGVAVNQAPANPHVLFQAFQQAGLIETEVSSHV